MTHRLRIVLTCMAVILSGILGFAALVATKPAQPVKEAATARTAVQVERVTLGEYTALIRETGTVQPKTSLDIVAEVSGKAIHASEDLQTGLFIKKDQLLVEIDPREFRLSVTQAKAQIAQLKAEMAPDRTEQGEPQAQSGTGAR